MATRQSPAEKTTNAARLPRRSRAPQPLSRQSGEQAPEPQEPHAASYRAVHPWDRLVHVALSRLTAGQSPAAILQAYQDWFNHLAISPGAQLRIARDAGEKSLEFANYAAQACFRREVEPCIKPAADDHRFRDETWQSWPFNNLYQSFLLTQQWLHNTVTHIAGPSEHHQNVVDFTSRQMLDGCSPSNFPLTNPQVLRRTVQAGGGNFVAGVANIIEDASRFVSASPPAGAEDYLPGDSVALTPGKVVYRNRLMELIQYSPTTEQVQAEPLLIVPAWIMKYYILDLSPGNSLVRWLVDQGHTVFMISWKNPDSGDRDLDMDDYRRLGIMQALEVVNAIVPERQAHAVGYCLGGTLLSITAAAMARDGDERIKTLSLFASLTDFHAVGELEMFIDESQLHFLEDVMYQQGYLEDWQMKSTFQFLQSNDLVWSRIASEYLMGERLPMFDLMAWSADGTRMPYRMHSQYLRRLYLDNALATGRFHVDGSPVLLDDIETPLFAVATRKDHIAPWRSVYSIQQHVNADVTFVLTSGGHNAGVVSEPGHRGRVYQIADKPAAAAYPDPGKWYAEVAEREGSWWPQWHAWLTEHCAGMTEPPTMGAPEKGFEPLQDAPGDYVLQR